MGPNRLPTRIAAVMLGTILVFVLTVAATNAWLGRALDVQAREQSLVQIRTARDNLLTQIRLTTLDYAKWATAVDAVDAGDVAWTYENIGGAATVGEIVQLVVVWAGRYGADFGWTDDDVREPRPGLLDPGTLDVAERLLAELPVGSFDSVEFFAWRDGAVYAMSAARLEVVDGSRPLPTTEDGMERILMGRRVTDAAIDQIAENFILTGLGIVREMPEGRPSMPLLGGDGAPVAYLAWDMPHPGTEMLRRMAGPIILTVLMMAALAAFGMTLVRRGAQHLVLAEHRASAAATTDDMTGLPNRAAFNAILSRPARAGERSILFLDVNDFKRINDSIGHAAGDQVLVEVARRLSAFVARGQFLARLAGDEFVFVLTGPDAQARTESLAAEVWCELEPPFTVMGHELRVSLAMGYAVQMDDRMDGEDLVRQADLAMYEAKRRERPEPVAFSALLERASGEAAAIERGLRAALGRAGELTVAYQPVIGASGRIEHAEALARWTSPELGVVPPSHFIAVAEKAGLIVELGRKIFRMICDDLAAHRGLKVSINVSPLQLMAPDFIPTMIQELSERGVDPARIEVELTESVIVEDLHLAAERLDELHAAGFSTALDDFGTGFSSVGYLGQLRFDTLKIDRSFVSQLHANTGSVAVVDGMITMAHGLDLRVVCEGIETAEELQLLRGLGCDLAQGFYLDPPLPIGTLARRWLGEDGRAAA